MRAVIVALALAIGLTGPAWSQDLSAEIGANGLAATEARLAALADPGPVDRFALGGVRFLHALEGTFQARYRTGMTDPSGMVPLLRLDQGVAPDAVFAPGDVAELFRQASQGLDAARAPLAGLAEGEDFALQIRLDDLWFDVDADGQRGPEEGLVQLLGPTLLGWEWFNRDPGAAAPVIRFDRADAAWLSAYTHLLGAVSDVVLAYDPTSALERVAKSHAALEALGPVAEDDFAAFGPTFDALWVILTALDQEPDAARLASARDHFLAMVADNRLFWQAVATETDNEGEWIPNDAQTSALGLQLAPGTGQVWLGVLADGEALLTGKKLVPYWRAGSAGGVNLGRVFTEPAPIDVKDWLQGGGAVPYLERGPLVTGDSWLRFERMLTGDALLMAVWLN